MGFFSALIALGLVSGIVSASMSSDSHWDVYKQVHGKVYKNRADEALRRSLFEQAKAEVERFNLEESDKAGYVKELNRFSDKTSEEKFRLNGLRMPEGHKLRNSPEADKFINDLLNDDSEVPKEVDWRKVPGRVSPVKDQGNCGSCWAFAVTGLLEGQETTHNKSKLTELSEQNLVDCPTEKDNLFGCDGGWISLGVEYVQKQGGVDDEKSYPYQGVGQECQFKKASVAFDARGAVEIPGIKEDKLQRLVAKYGPVAVAIAASEDLFSYKSGIYKGDCAENLTHAVLLVGYGTDKKHGDYWIIKNSWSGEWGEQGYLVSITKPLFEAYHNTIVWTVH